MNWLQDRPSNAYGPYPSFLSFSHESKRRLNPQAESDSDCSASLSPIRLLLVDDDRLSRIMTTNLLRANHVEVSQAENGLDALMQCQARAFDVVLTDLRMPVMDGETMAFRIRRHEAENGLAPCRIVALAASLGSPDSPLPTDGIFDAALEKPALIGEVLKAILG